ncbi:MAG: cob(I)yrinic acid a,c-diamide adenosyltransferase [Alphaproteobacteria bacterium]|jgi:cob(I)alamin adenosyltransferase|nr:ATP:cob(I)alamin adenosyltransferase [Rhodospirillaceae bacterium]MDP6023170.1 cob(I)yrinic acid a,c-diamide adenosyltransferase [Alphaproteobacteria bacterium]MDP6253587.1 cob(I)yrinic acid a,c-diamide adenosyltransferase [Alphaproteobacteria bacterium]MDP7055875.1 cob(I)yrinic acid a,c-diamide adenosyltransferase [Alphaproteobacteria bacterium]MDP7228990.1 cob(I)yrinic acid a,c-diamide adenosyltransferase [Alphaproteobacteria bacterium]|tara:strand:+ start:1781 stop:2344 length:564 start_codon:yes stop_codon:yes gene_type:complete
MVKLTKIYTRGGDGGLTSLSDGSRVAKDDLRVAAYGDVDELNAVIGLARQHADGAVDGMLARIQHDLFDLGADLATPIIDEPKYPPLRIVEAQVERLEQEIDRLGTALSTLNSFVLPGGTTLAAHLHLGRTVARRAERVVTTLAHEAEINPAALRYLNRLSDHLFQLARHANVDGAADILWVPGTNC